MGEDKARQRSNVFLLRTLTGKAAEYRRTPKREHPCDVSDSQNQHPRLRSIEPLVICKTCAHSAAFDSAISFSTEKCAVTKSTSSQIRIGSASSRLNKWQSSQRQISIVRLRHRNLSRL